MSVFLSVYSDCCFCDLLFCAAHVANKDLYNSNVNALCLESDVLMLLYESKSKAWLTTVRLKPETLTWRPVWSSLIWDDCVINVTGLLVDKAVKVSCEASHSFSSLLRCSYSAAKKFSAAGSRASFHSGNVVCLLFCIFLLVKHKRRPCYTKR